MRTLAELADYQLLARRFAAVSPQDEPRWGKMNAYRMLRYVADAIRVPLGGIQVREQTSLLRQTFMKREHSGIPDPGRPMYPRGPNWTCVCLESRSDTSKPPAGMPSLSSTACTTPSLRTYATPYLEA